MSCHLLITAQLAEELATETPRPQGPRFFGERRLVERPPAWSTEVKVSVGAGWRAVASAAH